MANDFIFRNKDAMAMEEEYTLGKCRQIFEIAKRSGFTPERLNYFRVKYTQERDNFLKGGGNLETLHMDQLPKTIKEKHCRNGEHR